MYESEEDKLIRKQREAKRNTIAPINRQMTIEQLKEQIERERGVNPDWPKDDERMIQIGQNGNTGEHYDKI